VSKTGRTLTTQAERGCCLEGVQRDGWPISEQADERGDNLWGGRPSGLGEGVEVGQD